MVAILRAMKKLIILFVLVFTQVSRASGQQIDYRKINQVVAEKLLTTVNGCGERIWPGYDLKSLDIVLVDNSSEDLITVSFNNNKISTTPASRLPIYIKQTSFAYFNIDGQEMMSINGEDYTQGIDIPEETVEELTFKLAIHESFHHTTQKQWNKSKRGSRGTFVPITWEPRYYRAMIFKNLVEAYQSEESKEQSLQRAKYWYEKWNNEYPEEVKATTDGYEGTAKYSDIMARALSESSCTAREPEIKTKIKTSYIDELERMINGYRFALDSEGYPVGSVAALLLRENKKQTGWEASVAEGETPLSILMKDVQASYEDIDGNFKLRFLDTQREKQADVDQYLSDTYVALKQKDSYLVSLPDSWLGEDGASYTFTNFYIDVGLDLNFSVMAEELLFTSKDKSSSLKSSQTATFFWLEKNPCRDWSQWVFAAGEKSFALENSNLLKIKTKDFQGNLKGKVVKDENGRNWFCSGEE